MLLLLSLNLFFDENEIGRFSNVLMFIKSWEESMLSNAILDDEKDKLVLSNDSPRTG